MGARKRRPFYSWPVAPASAGRELCGRCYYHMSGDNEHLFNGGSESEEESELGSHLGSDPGSDADGESETEVE